jgi:hypothetical protein
MSEGLRKGHIFVIITFFSSGFCFDVICIIFMYIYIIFFGLWSRRVSCFVTLIYFDLLL